MEGDKSNDDMDIIQQVNHTVIEHDELIINDDR